VSERAVQDTVADVAGNVLRKYLPPSQRLYIRRPKLHELKEFTVAFTGPGGATGAVRGRTLEQLMSSYLIGPPPFYHRPMSDFLFETGRLSSGSPFYKAARFLQVPLRQIVDLWQLLAASAPQAGSGGPSSRTTSAFRLLPGLNRFGLDSLRSEEGLTPEARGAVEAWLDGSLSSGGGPPTATVALTAARLRRRLNHRSEPAGGAPEIRRSVRIGRDCDWSLRFQNVDGRLEPLAVSPEFVGILMFTSDLYTVRWPDESSNPLLSVGPQAVLTLAGVRIRLQGQWTPWLPFPFPPLRTFREVDQFCDAWGSLVQRVEGLGSRYSTRYLIPHTVHNWIRIGVDLLRGSTSESPPDLSAAVPRTAWSGVVSGAVGVIGSYQSLTDGPRVLGWLAEAFSLLNPMVIGQDHTVHQAILGSKPFVKLRRRIRIRIPRQWHLLLRRHSLDTGLKEHFLKTFLEGATWWTSPPPASGDAAPPASGDAAPPASGDAAPPGPETQAPSRARRTRRKT
jgi:hypothetical protein